MITLIMKQDTFAAFLESFGGVKVFSSTKFDAAGEGYYSTTIELNDLKPEEEQQYSFQFAQSEAAEGRDAVFIHRIIYIDGKQLNIWFNEKNEMFSDDWIKDDDELIDAVQLFGRKSWESLTTFSGKKLTRTEDK